MIRLTACRSAKWEHTAVLIPMMYSFLFIFAFLINNSQQDTCLYCTCATGRVELSQAQCLPKRPLAVTYFSELPVCVCAITRYTFLHLQYIYLYHTCVLKSEFGHIWLLTNLVYLLKLLYANSCVVGGRMAWNLFILSIVCVCTFFCSFLYGALCPRSC